jgi:transposase
MVEQIDLSYPTVLKALTVMRMAIVANSPDLQLLAGEIELDESYFGGKRKGKRGRGAFNKVPVFGILERDGIVKVEVVNDVSAETLLNLTIKTVRRGSIVYTDKFRSYDAFLYLKEMEFRYNNRNTEIFHELAKYLANLVPDLL